jgi:hypothetical protein
MSRPLPRTTSDPDAISDLRDLCNRGHLYAVEGWIQQGRPLQLAPGIRPRGRRHTSALRIALERGDHALAYLLLCNGYDPDAEEESLLNLALQSRRFDLLDLLLDWGADPQRVSRAAVFETYSSQLMERFRAFGVDMTDGHEMAEVLTERTSNKPLFGFAKRHREKDPRIQRELDIALRYHASEGNEKGVMLCLWAGADPHAPVPDLRWPAEDEEDDDEPSGLTAVWCACFHGNADVLERLRPDPMREDFDDLYRWAGSAAVIDILAKHTLPKNVGPVIAARIPRRRHDFDIGGRWSSLEPLRRLFQLGVRWTAGSKDEVANARHALLKASDYDFVETIKLLAQADHCSQDVLHELARTPAFRRKMTETGLIPRAEEEHWKWQQRRPTRAHEVVAKCGLDRSKGKDSKGRSASHSASPVRALPRTVHVGYGHRNGRVIRLTRAEFFNRVWSKPMLQLAAEWGISDQGLAKVCRRLNVPRPPRGFWAKKQAGHKVQRPRLPTLPAGEAEEILIHVPK